MPIIYLHVYICTAHNIYPHVYICPNICTYTYALPIIYPHVYICTAAAALAHASMKWVVLIMNDRCNACPPDEGICLMCKSFVGGQYLRWLQLSRLVFACHKAPPIFAVSPQSFEVISLPQKSNSNAVVVVVAVMLC